MPDDDHSPSRPAWLEERNRRLRWAAVLAAAMVLATAGTVSAFILTDDAPAAAPAVTLSGLEANVRSPSTTVPTGAFPVRSLSHEDPLRLWVGGDSLAGTLGPALGQLAGATGIVATDVDYKVSSGLEPGPRDWPSHATLAMAARNPEAVVFMVGTNDTNVVDSFDGDHDGVPDWEPAYRNRVGAMMDLLAGPEPERTVIWIGAPTLRDKGRNAAVVKLNRIVEEEAAKRGPAVLYVDAYTLFGDENGQYTASLDTGDGRARVRIGDGVHFTEAGAAYLAKPVMALLDGRYHLEAQADPSRPIPVTIEPGGESGGDSTSGSAPGSGSDSGSDSGDGGSTGSSGSSGSGSITRSGSSGSNTRSGSGGSGGRTPRPTAPPAQSAPPERTPPPDAAPEPTSPPATSPPATDPPSEPDPPTPPADQPSAG